MTTVSTSMVVRVPFSSACEYAADFFEQRPTLNVQGPLSAADVSTGFRVVDDITDSARVHEAVLFSWHAKYAFLPDLAATLRVRPYQGQARLYVDGRYTPPFGIAGGIFDRVAGRRIARHSLNAMLNELSAYMLGRYRSFRDSIPPDERTASGAS